MTEAAFVVLGRLDQLTGVIDDLGSRGQVVKVIGLGSNDCATELAELAGGTTTVIDGLALLDRAPRVAACRIGGERRNGGNRLWTWWPSLHLKTGTSDAILTHNGRAASPSGGK